MYELFVELRIMTFLSKVLGFISYFPHERSWSSLKLEKMSEIEMLDYTE